MRNKKKGISLIVLVITIIIMIILAAAVIITLSNAGIIGIAENAVDKTNVKEAKELISLELLELDAAKKGKLKLEELGEITNEQITVETTYGTEANVYEDEGRKYVLCSVDKYVFRVYDDWEIVLAEEAQLKKPESVAEEYGYVTDGLVVFYDGKNNTGNGHDGTTNIWTNLAEETKGKNDGILMNVDFTEASGWTEDSLILDGNNDWVKMSYTYYENMTVEIVTKPLDINISQEDDYISNFQNGGMGIVNMRSNYNSGQVNINGTYVYAASEEPVSIGNVYSMSTRYDGQNIYFSENGNVYAKEIGGTYTDTQESTIFAMGTNPQGDTESLATGQTRVNMEIYSVRIYNRCLTEEEVKNNYLVDKNRYKITNEKKSQELGYVSDGLVCHLDGEQNTLYGHSKKTTTWMDLSGNSKNGTLKNINFTTSSGWMENSLILDGKNDWVKLLYMHSSNMTIEIVAKPLSITSGKLEPYLANYQNGGLGFRKSKDGYLQFGAYIGGSYTWTSSTDLIKVGEVYSVSAGYDGTNLYFRKNESTYNTPKTGTFGKPQDSTVFAIGTNPDGVEENMGDSEKRANIEVYSVRIYNRCLTEEERQQNYEIDKKRFGI